MPIQTGRSVPPSVRRGQTADGRVRTEAPVGPPALLRLQRTAGNAAVAGLLRRASAPPAPGLTVMRQAAPAGQCATQQAPPAPARDLPGYDKSIIAGSEPIRAVMGYIRHRDQGQGTLGVTIWPRITEHSVPGVRFIPTRGRDGRWSARVTRTWLPGRPHIEAFSPRPGVHHLPSSSGTGSYLYFGRDAADRVDEGEREHVGDILYAWRAVTSILDEAISRLMLLRPPKAASEQLAIECSNAWLRSALPPRLRWPLDRGVAMGMIQAMTSLGTTSWRRDDAWHQLGTRTLVVAEKRRLGIPVEAWGREVLDDGHEIGAHSTDHLIRAKWTSLPALD